MEVLRKITKEGKTYGYMLSDMGEQIPIVEDALWVKDIMDALLMSDYKLVGLPFDLVDSEGNHIKDLQSVELSTLKLSNEEVTEMACATISRYSTEEVQKKLDVEEASVEEEYIDFKKGTIKIKTREELIDFLTKRHDILSSTVSDMLVLPINSFTADEALLTQKEYFAPENSKLRALIRETTRLTFPQFRHLLSIFKGLGLRDDFTPKQLMDMYMDYGIPGLKFNCINKVTKQSPYMLGVDMSDTNVPTLKYSELTYLDSDGKIHRTPIMNKKDKWEPVPSEDVRHEMMNKLFRLGKDFIAPIAVRKDITDEITTMDSMTLEAKYNSERLMLKAHNRTYIDPIITVLAPGSKSEVLDSELFNISSSDIIEALENKALSRCITAKTIVKSDASTYNVLKSVGASLISSVSYVANVDGILDQYVPAEVDEHGKKKPVDTTGFVISVDKYLEGKLEVTDPMYEIVEGFVSDFVGGLVNADLLESGKTSDMRLLSESNYEDYIAVARDFLGIPFQDLYARICNITKDTQELILHGNDLSLRIPIVHVSRAAQAFSADRQNYLIDMAENSSIYMSVKKIYAELSTTKIPGRHIAIKYDYINMFDSKIAKSLKSVINTLQLWCIDMIRSNYLETDMMRDKLEDMVKINVIKGLFQIAYVGKFTFMNKFTKATSKDEMVTLDFSGMVSNPTSDYGPKLNGPQVRAAISNAMVEAVSTLSVVTDFLTSVSGKFITFCANATITPSYVIPNKGFKIDEICLNAAALNISGGSEQTYIKAFKQHNIFPEDDIKLMESGYYRSLPKLSEQSHFPIMVGEHLQAINTIPGNLLSYLRHANEEIETANSMRDNNTFENPSLPVLVAYPKYGEIMGINTDGDDYLYRGSGERVDGKFIYRMYPYNTVTNEVILNRDPKLRKLFKIQISEIETSEYVGDLKGLSPEDFIEVGGMELLDSFGPMEDGIAAVFADTRTNEINFEDGAVVTPNTIADYAKTGKYKIRRISSRKYICQLMSRKLIQVEF